MIPNSCSHGSSHYRTFSLTTSRRLLSSSPSPPPPSSPPSSPSSSSLPSSSASSSSSSVSNRAARSTRATPSSSSTSWMKRPHNFKASKPPQRKEATFPAPILDDIMASSLSLSDAADAAAFAAREERTKKASAKPRKKAANAADSKQPAAKTSKASSTDSKSPPHSKASSSATAVKTPKEAKARPSATTSVPSSDSGSKSRPSDWTMTPMNPDVKEINQRLLSISTPDISLSLSIFNDLLALEEKRKERINATSMYNFLRTLPDVPADILDTVIVPAVERNYLSMNALVVTEISRLLIEAERYEKAHFFLKELPTIKNSTPEDKVHCFVKALDLFLRHDQCTFAVYMFSLIKFFRHPPNLPFNPNITYPESLLRLLVHKLILARDYSLALKTVRRLHEEGVGVDEVDLYRLFIAYVRLNLNESFALWPLIKDAIANSRRLQLLGDARNFVDRREHEVRVIFEKAVGETILRRLAGSGADKDFVYVFAAEVLAMGVALRVEILDALVAAVVAESVRVRGARRNLERMVTAAAPSTPPPASPSATAAAAHEAPGESAIVAKKNELEKQRKRLFDHFALALAFAEKLLVSAIPPDLSQYYISYTSCLDKFPYSAKVIKLLSELVHEMSAHDRLDDSDSLLRLLRKYRIAPHHCMETFLSSLARNASPEQVLAFVEDCRTMPFLASVNTKAERQKQLTEEAYIESLRAAADIFDASHGPSQRRSIISLFNFLETRIYPVYFNPLYDAADGDDSYALRRFPPTPATPLITPDMKEVLQRQSRDAGHNFAGAASRGAPSWRHRGHEEERAALSRFARNEHEEEPAALSPFSRSEHEEEPPTLSRFARGEDDEMGHGFDPVPHADEDEEDVKEFAASAGLRRSEDGDGGDEEYDPYFNEKVDDDSLETFIRRRAAHSQKIALKISFSPLLLNLNNFTPFFLPNFSAPLPPLILSPQHYHLLVSNILDYPQRTISRHSVVYFDDGKVAKAENPDSSLSRDDSPPDGSNFYTLQTHHSSDISFTPALCLQMAYRVYRVMLNAGGVPLPATLSLLLHHAHALGNVSLARSLFYSSCLHAAPLDRDATLTFIQVCVENYLWKDAQSLFHHCIFHGGLHFLAEKHFLSLFDLFVQCDRLFEATSLFTRLSYESSVGADAAAPSPGTLEAPAESHDYFSFLKPQSSESPSSPPSSSLSSSSPSSPLSSPGSLLSSSSPSSLPSSSSSSTLPPSSSSPSSSPSPASPSEPSVFVHVDDDLALDTHVALPRPEDDSRRSHSHNAHCSYKLTIAQKIVWLRKLVALAVKLKSSATEEKFLSELRALEGELSAATVVYLLPIYAHMQRFDAVERCVQHVHTHGFERGAEYYGARIQQLVHDGAHTDAVRVYEECRAAGLALPTQDVEALIMALLQSGRKSDAAHYLATLQNARVQPPADRQEILINYTHHRPKPPHKEVNAVPDLVDDEPQRDAMNTNVDGLVRDSTKILSHEDGVGDDHDDVSEVSLREREEEESEDTSNIAMQMLELNLRSSPSAPLSSAAESPPSAQLSASFWNKILRVALLDGNLTRAELIHEQMAALGIAADPLAHTHLAALQEKRELLRAVEL